MAAPRAVPRCDLGAMSSVLPKAGRRKNGGLRCRDGRTWGVSSFFFVFSGWRQQKVFRLFGQFVVVQVLGVRKQKMGSQPKRR